MRLQKRNVIHLLVTPSTLLRVVLQVQDLEWYKQEDLHPAVVKALHPIIVGLLVNANLGKSASKRKKEVECPKSLNQARYRIVYRFLWQDVHYAMLQRDHRRYKSLSIYPYQLIVFVDKPNHQASLETYFAAQ
ncbi:hypothetical protein BX666DRAFT_1951311 [Dichotomocladium elegans]|nr:hypothetical protein BX666DRAFT_1951311 [Dichotomocladium elegans]